MKNKLDCFSLFQEARSAWRRPGYGELPLGELVARASSLDSFRALWATEGLGYGYAEAAWQETVPGTLLIGDRCGSLPAGSLTPLHAGMGLAFAVRLFRGAAAGTPVGIRAALKQFIALCRANAREGCAEIAIEGLGLVVRTLYPRLLLPIDRDLKESNRDLVDLFWHGVGRGLYFAPTQTLSSASWAWRGLAKARHEAPHDLGRQNAVAGLAWALTLVNLRQPGVMAQFLKRYADLLAADDAFANGVGSAAMVWHHWAPASPLLGAFVEHRCDPELADHWQKLVRRPCLVALRLEYPALAKTGRVGMLFRFRQQARQDEAERGAVGGPLSS